MYFVLELYNINYKAHCLDLIKIVYIQRNFILGWCMQQRLRRDLLFAFNKSEYYIIYDIYKLESVIRLYIKTTRKRLENILLNTAPR